MISIPIHHDLTSFNATFRRYVALTGKTPDEMLEKKGRDLGIRLFRGFRDRQWGGAGKNPRIARAELAARTALGQGTKVRPSLLRQYMQQRAALRASIRNFAGKKTAARELRDIKRRVSLWQSFVGKEVGLRQRGRGALAAAFLWYRRRSSQAKGTYYVKNRTGSPIGYVERGEGFFRIVSDVVGSDIVDSRYSVVDVALAGAEADMLTYIQRKERENFRSVFGGAAA